MGQDQVSGGVSVLCWLAAPVQCSMEISRNLIIWSKLVIKSSSMIGSKIGVMSDQLTFILTLSTSFFVNCGHHELL